MYGVLSRDGPAVLNDLDTVIETDPLGHLAELAEAAQSSLAAIASVEAGGDVMELGDAMRTAVALALESLTTSDHRSILQYLSDGPRALK